MRRGISMTFEGDAVAPLSAGAWEATEGATVDGAATGRASLRAVGRFAGGRHMRRRPLPGRRSKLTGSQLVVERSQTLIERRWRGGVNLGLLHSGALLISRGAIGGSLVFFAPVHLDCSPRMYAVAP